MRQFIKKKPMRSMQPWYRGFTGTIRPSGESGCWNAVAAHASLSPLLPYEHSPRQIRLPWCVHADKQHHPADNGAAAAEVDAGLQGVSWTCIAASISWHAPFLDVWKLLLRFLQGNMPGGDHKKTKLNIYDANNSVIYGLRIRSPCLHDASAARSGNTTRTEAFILLFAWTAASSRMQRRKRASKRSCV